MDLTNLTTTMPYELTFLTLSCESTTEYKLLFQIEKSGIICHLIRIRQEEALNYHLSVSAGKCSFLLFH